MRPIFLLSFAGLFLLPGKIMAQAGMNSISISTTSEGNIAWNASIDGYNRKGYYDKHMSAGICDPKTVDKDVLVPVTSNLYPSPFTDMLFFTGTGYDNFTVTIKDLEGNVMATQKYTNRTSMDISSFANGIYTIEIVAEKTGQVRTKKLVKE